MWVPPDITRHSPPDERPLPPEDFPGTNEEDRIPDPTGGNHSDTDTGVTILKSVFSSETPRTIIVVVPV